jgi:hypothetical protein
VLDLLLLAMVARLLLTAGRRTPAFVLLAMGYGCLLTADACTRSHNWPISRTWPWHGRRHTRCGRDRTVVARSPARAEPEPDLVVRE